jgi:GWxTD domain-containing protein
MRILIIFILFIANSIVFGQNIEAYFSLSRFNIPEERPFIDVFISFNARTVAYNKGKANIESTILIKNGNHIVDFRKTQIKSELLNEDSIPIDFLDVQRFSLKNGKYTIEILLRDLNLLNADTIKISYPFDLFFGGFHIEISDIELVDRLEKSDETNLFTKAGYQVIPYVSDYYNSSRNEIIFYAEVYNTDSKIGKGNKYLVVAQIASSGDEIISSYRKMIREESADVNVVLNKFDISELYSGNYQIQIEVRDKENKLLQTKSFPFYRNNPMPMSELLLPDSVFNGEVLFTEVIVERDVLMEYIKSMWPRADRLERNIIDNQIPGSSTEVLQQFMYAFWYKRDDKNPQNAWDEYHDLVEIVENLYSTQIRKGYETDRGRVFLQYGKPNKLVAIPVEPNAYPYEIWQYYHVENFNNIKFVFYNKDLSTNDYVLLHSDMPGEIYNRRWNIELHSRVDPMNVIDDNSTDPHYGGHSKDFYENPR